MLVGIALAIALVGCAPQKGTIKPIVDVTAPGGSVINTRPEAYLGESDGFSEAESACFVRRLEEADIPEYQFRNAPTGEVHEQVLGIMGDCLREVAATSTTSTTTAAVPGAPTTVAGAVPAPSTTGAP